MLHSNRREVIWFFALGWATLMVLNISRHRREIILMIKIDDFKEIYILYEFVKISVEAILRKIQFKVYNILSRTMKNQNKILTHYSLDWFNLYYFLTVWALFYPILHYRDFKHHSLHGTLEIQWKTRYSLFCSSYFHDICKLVKKDKRVNV